MGYFKLWTSWERDGDRWMDVVRVPGTLCLPLQITGAAPWFVDYVVAYHMEHDTPEGRRVRLELVRCSLVVNNWL